MSTSRQIPDRASDRRHRRTAVAMATMVVTLGACSSGPTASDIAAEACSLARRVASGDVGLLALALETNAIREKAQSADIRFGEVLSESQRACPDVYSLLGL